MAIAAIAKITTTIPSGKIKCYITGQLRKDTPEEQVRQRVARSIVEEYGYDRADIELERSIQLGTNKKRADIVIFEAGQSHKHENIHIIVEAKRDTIKPSHKDQGIPQLKSYLAATPNVEYGLWVGSEMRAFHKDTSNKKVVFEDILNIPLATGKAVAPNSFSALVPATDVLKDVFKRCHSYISANQGGSKEFAFHEFLKMTFCKVFDEKYSSKPRFFIFPGEQKATAGLKALATRTEQLFQDVCKQYGYIFGEDDTLKLKPSVIRPHHVDGIPLPCIPEEVQKSISKKVEKAFNLRSQAIALLNEAKAMVYEELGAPRHPPTEDVTTDEDE